MYLDCSVPTKPTMHVAETPEDEDIVLSNYSWSWGEYGCKQVIACVVQIAIYTPNVMNGPLGN